MKHLLKYRAERVTKLGRNLLKHIRAFGNDPKAQSLRLRLAHAVIRLDGLVRRYAYNQDIVEKVLQVRVGLLGLQDQIEATLSTAQVGRSPKP